MFIFGAHKKFTAKIKCSLSMTFFVSRNAAIGKSARNEQCFHKLATGEKECSGIFLHASWLPTIILCVHQFIPEHIECKA